MIDTERLTVSLTKNGYLKIAELVKEYPRDQILDHCDRDHQDIKLNEAQVANILSQDAVNDSIPAAWDEIKEYGALAVESLTLLAIIFSHHRLLRLFRETSQGQSRGCLTRDDMTIKEFTNLVYAMATLRLCAYRRGAESVNYNLLPLIENLRAAGPVVRQVIESKLVRCGWRDPEFDATSRDDDFWGACRTAGFIGALGMTAPAFRRWIEGE